MYSINAQLILVCLFNFQFLIVMSICTNCAFLVWFYDHEGKWSIEPGLAIILVMEHILLLIKFGFSRFVPEVTLVSFVKYLLFHILFSYLCRICIIL